MMMMMMRMDDEDGWVMQKHSLLSSAWWWLQQNWIVNSYAIHQYCPSWSFAKGSVDLRLYSVGYGTQTGLNHTLDPPKKIQTKMWATKKTRPYFPLKYWLFNRDPCNGLWKSPHNCVVFHPLDTLNNQVPFFHCSCDFHVTSSSLFPDLSIAERCHQATSWFRGGISTIPHTSINPDLFGWCWNNDWQVLKVDWLMKMKMNKCFLQHLIVPPPSTTSIKPNPKPHKNIRSVTPKLPKAPFVRASRRGVTLEVEISAKFVATWPSGRLLFLNVHLDTGYVE